MKRWLGPLLVVAIPLVASCSSPSQQARPGAPSGHHPVVVVLVDGVRVDHLGGDQTRPSVTPNLDRFAAGAVRFDWAFAQAPEPTSSAASLLTGLYPTTHGLVERGDRLADEAATLAEVLGAAGFETAAFIEADSGAEDLGLAQGFGTFVTGPQALDRALSWLGQHAGSDLFLLIEPESITPALAGVENVSEMYVQQLEAVDRAVGRILDAIGAADLAERATVAVVSATGCELGEHGAAGEPTIYAPVTHVPLLLRSPGWSSGRSIDKIVELIDLMPTLLDLAGVETPAAVQGRSLVPLTAGPGSPPYIAFGESPSDGGRYFAALGGYRLVLRSEGDVAELYELAADRLEVEDLAAVEEKKVAVLRDHLAAWQKMVAAASLDPERRVEELDEDTLEQLKSLGYIQ